MAVKISNIQVTPAVATVGQTIKITVTAVDVNWEVIKTDFTNWTAIKNDFPNWTSVLNYH